MKQYYCDARIDYCTMIPILARIPVMVMMLICGMVMTMSLRISVACRYGMGQIYFRQEKFEEAEYHFRKALSVSPL